MNISYIVEVPGLGARIKAARGKSPKSTTQIAADAGMSVNCLYQIENEKHKSCSIAQIRCLESSLGVKFLSNDIPPVILEEQANDSQ